jgi:hypothetical protein
LVQFLLVTRVGDPIQYPDDTEKKSTAGKDNEEVKTKKIEQLNWSTHLLASGPHSYSSNDQNARKK